MDAFLGAYATILDSRVDQAEGGGVFDMAAPVPDAVGGGVRPRLVVRTAVDEDEMAAVERVGVVVSEIVLVTDVMESRERIEVRDEGFTPVVISFSDAK